MAQFSWAAAADVAGGLLGAFGRAQSAKATADLNNAVREGNNEIARAQRGLAATVRGINNKRIMEAAGKNLDAATATAIRTADAVGRRNFEESIRSAEQWGAAAARGAASGLGGAGIEAISRTTSLQIERRRELLESQGSDLVDEATRRTESILSDALMSTEQGPLIARRDDGRSTSPGMAGMLIEGLLSKRESLQVLLGSLVPGQEPVSNPIPTAQAQGVPLGPVQPARADFAFTTPVPDQSVVGVPLQPRGFEQADVRRLDNITLN